MRSCAKAIIQRENGNSEKKKNNNNVKKTDRICARFLQADSVNNSPENGEKKKSGAEADWKLM